MTFGIAFLRRNSFFLPILWSRLKSIASIGGEARSHQSFEPGNVRIPGREEMREIYIRKQIHFSKLFLTFWAAQEAHRSLPLDATKRPLMGPNCLLRTSECRFSVCSPLSVLALMLGLPKFRLIALIDFFLVSFRIFACRAQWPGWRIGQLVAVRIFDSSSAHWRNKRAEHSANSTA